MNDIAALCILYKDFRYELKHLKSGIEDSRTGSDQEAYYWIRRSLLTMTEFGRRLTSVLGKANKEIIDSISEDKRNALLAARRAISKSSLQTLRNYFGRPHRS